MWFFHLSPGKSLRTGTMWSYRPNVELLEGLRGSRSTSMSLMDMGPKHRGGMCLFCFMYVWMNKCIHNHMHCYYWQPDGRSHTAAQQTDTFFCPNQRSLTGTVIHVGSHYCWNLVPEKLTWYNVQAVSKRQNDLFQWSLPRSHRSVTWGCMGGWGRAVKESLTNRGQQTYCLNL